MLRYLETFYRHRLLLAAPLAVCLAVGLSYVVTQPRQYQSVGKIWVERSSLGNANPEFQYMTPAEAQSGVLDELLKSHSFAVAVDKRVGLTDDMLARQRRQGPTAGDRLTALMHGHLHVPPPAQPTDDQRANTAFDTVSKRTLVTVTGPNVVALTFTYPDARFAAAVTKAILDQFIAETQTGNKAQADASVSFYGQQVKEAEKLLVAADGKVYAYLGAHPEQNAANAIPDQTLSQLRRDDDLARQRYQAVLAKLDGAELNAAVAQTSAPTGIRVLDTPQAPERPVSGLKVYLSAGGGSVVAGLFLAFVILLLLTAADTSVRHAREVEPAFGLRVVAVVPRLPRWAR